MVVVLSVCGQMWSHNLLCQVFKTSVTEDKHRLSVVYLQDPQILPSIQLEFIRVDSKLKRAKVKAKHMGSVTKKKVIQYHTPICINAKD